MIDVEEDVKFRKKTQKLFLNRTRNGCTKRQTRERFNCQNQSFSQQFAAWPTNRSVSKRGEANIHRAYMRTRQKIRSKFPIDIAAAKQFRPLLPARTVFPFFCMISSPKHVFFPVGGSANRTTAP